MKKKTAREVTRTNNLSNACLKQGTIIRTGITCKQIPLQKSTQFGMTLKYRPIHYKQKTEISLVTRPLT